VDFTESFFLFGEHPSAGNVFYFGTRTRTGFPSTIQIAVNLALILPEVQLTWEFLSVNTWQTIAPVDGTNNFIQDSDVVLVFPEQPPVTELRDE
jgi:hypothetical protein